MSLSKREFEVQRDRETPAARVERARTQIKRVARDVQTTEGRLLDYETADGMQRAPLLKQQAGNLQTRRGENDD